MALDPRLEHYLASIHRALHALPLSDRADIVMELKSHVLASLERNPEGSLDEILRSLGEPEQVASRYLLERGLAPMKPPVSPIVKWLVIGFLGTLGFLVLGFGFLLYSLSPLISVNEKEGRVSIFGGLIAVDEKAGTFRLGFGSEKSKGSTLTLGGVSSAKGIEKIEVRFSNGRIRLATSKEEDSSKVRWECRVQSAQESKGPVLKEDKSSTFVNLEDSTYEDCRVTVPEKTAVELKAKAGLVEIEDPQFSLKARLENGRINVKPNARTPYSIKSQVGLGNISGSPRQDANPLYSLELSVGTGTIHVQDSY